MTRVMNQIAQAIHQSLASRERSDRQDLEGMHPAQVGVFINPHDVSSVLTIADIAALVQLKLAARDRDHQQELRRVQWETDIAAFRAGQDNAVEIVSLHIRDAVEELLQGTFKTVVNGLRTRGDQPKSTIDHERRYMEQRAELLEMFASTLRSIVGGLPE